MNNIRLPVAFSYIVNDSNIPYYDIISVFVGDILYDCFQVVMVSDITKLDILILWHDIMLIVVDLIY